MSITIITAESPACPLLARDMRDGCAYMREDGILFIGSRFQCDNSIILGFSVNGEHLAWDTAHWNYREVSIEVRVL